MLSSRISSCSSARAVVIHPLGSELLQKGSAFSIGWQESLVVGIPEEIAVDTAVPTRPDVVGVHIGDEDNLPVLARAFLPPSRRIQEEMRHSLPG